MGSIKFNILRYFFELSFILFDTLFLNPFFRYQILFFIFTHKHLFLRFSLSILLFPHLFFFLMSRISYYFLCFLLGGFFGWVGDSFHVLTSVLEYPSHHIFWLGELSWWVVPQFGMGGLSLAFVVHVIAQFWFRRYKEYQISKSFPTYSRGALAVLFSLGSYLLSSLLSHLDFTASSISLILLASTILLTIYLQVYSSRNLLLFSILSFPFLFLFGITYESSLCYLGFFRYISPCFIGGLQLYVSHWIGWLWYQAVLAVVLPMWRYEYEEWRSNYTQERKKN